MTRGRARGAGGDQVARPAIVASSSDDHADFLSKKNVLSNPYLTEFFSQPRLSMVCLLSAAVCQRAEGENSMAEHPEEVLLTPAEAADILHHKAPTLERWRKTGYGPRFVKFGKRVAYRREAIDAWIRSQERAHTADTTPLRRSQRRPRNGR
jgi:predicted DNA-binding transcriptional regulator AlpA